MILNQNKHAKERRLSFYDEYCKLNHNPEAKTKLFLNPCCTGCTAPRMNKTLHELEKESLNPCCTGCTAPRTFNYKELTIFTLIR